MHYKLPKDIQDISLTLVRGHSRCISDFPNILQQLGAGQAELRPEVIHMQATEKALAKFCEDIPSHEATQRLRNRILLNCESGREYPPS